MKTVLSIVGVLAVVCVVLIFARLESATTHAQEVTKAKKNSKPGRVTSPPPLTSGHAGPAIFNRPAGPFPVQSVSNSFGPHPAPARSSRFGHTPSGIGTKNQLNSTLAPPTGGTAIPTTNIGVQPSHSQARTNQTLRSAVTKNFPKNARNVKNLVRVEYSLPDAAAKTLVELFSQDADQRIETRTEASDSSPFVSLQVTTDDATQRAVASFLNAVYPEEKLNAIRAEFESAKTADDTKEATAVKFLGNEARDEAVGEAEGESLERE